MMFVILFIYGTKTSAQNYTIEQDIPFYINGGEFHIKVVGFNDGNGVWITSTSSRGELIWKVKDRFVAFTKQTYVQPHSCVESSGVEHFNITEITSSDTITYHVKFDGMKVDNSERVEWSVTGRTSNSGKLIVHTDTVGAEIYYIKGTIVEQIMIDEHKDLPPGAYKIQVVKKGYLTWSRDIMIEAGRVSEFFVRLVQEQDKSATNSIPSKHEETPKTGQGKVLSWLQGAAACFNLEMAGYDCQCAKAVAQMYKEGSLSQGQAQFLINQNCKRPQQQNMQQEQNLPSLTCPICGQIGRSNVGFNGIYYTCPRGHSWR